MPDTARPASTDPWGIQFDQLQSYPALMGGGRRKPALPIGGPAVTWHLGFWVPEKLTLDRAAWVKEIERFIRKLYKHLEELAKHDDGFRPHSRSFQRNGQGQLYLLNNIYPVDDCEAESIGIIKDQATRYQTFRVRFHYGAMPVAVSLEVNDEYFTLATIIDLAWAGNPERIAKLGAEDRSAITNLTAAVADFNSVATARYANALAEDSEKTKHDDRGAFRPCYRTIYSEAWQTFFERVFKPPYDKVKSRKCLGEIFLNVRGFVACAGEHTFIGGPGTFIGGPASHVNKTSTAQRIGTRVFGDLDAVRRVDVLLPWLKADQGFTSPERDVDADRTEPIEFTFTKISDSRAIFASALGAQLSRLRDAQAPMTYMVLARNQARWQLGRIVHHIHTLIGLRLAALYDLHYLINAGVELRSLDERLEAWIRSEDQNRDLISAFSDELTAISQQADKETRLPQIAGGLAHRVERSRYYRMQAEHTAGEMRDRRIEGFPTYSDAVRRRLGGIYDLIDMIGQRLGRLQERVAGVNRGLTATAMFHLQQRLATQATLIKGFQKVAEVAVFLGLWPDAFSNVVGKWVGENPRWEQWSAALASAVGFGIVMREWLVPLHHRLVAFNRRIIRIGRWRVKKARRRVHRGIRTLIRKSRNLIRSAQERILRRD